MDAWSSATQVPFLDITGYYIEGRTWQFRSLLLGFERLRGSHTADALARVSLSVLPWFHISNHIRAITTDNATVNTKILCILQDSLIGFNTTDNQICCMVHVINLSVQVLLSHLKVTPIDKEVDTIKTSKSMNRIPAVFVTRAL